MPVPLQSTRVDASKRTESIGREDAGAVCVATAALGASFVSTLSRSLLSADDPQPHPPQQQFHRLQSSPRSSTSSFSPHHSHLVSSSFGTSLALGFGPGTSATRLKTHSESLVGSYEESLLSGRTSTPPSKPAVTFLARIGVLGTGATCPPRLRCPRHISLEFAAVYYDWQGMVSVQQQQQQAGPAGLGIGGSTVASAGASSVSATAVPGDSSPYVGVLDLEGYYSTFANKKQQQKQAQTSNSAVTSPSSSSSLAPLPSTPTTTTLGYRIPEQGQIQIVISNPHRTAIKLYLVPYDLRDMPAGTRTFIRQKIFVADDTSSVAAANKSAKGSLRQAVHLEVVCPSRGKYFLFRSIRVVFENRALDATSSSSTTNGISSSPFLLNRCDNVRIETVVAEYATYFPHSTSSHRGSAYSPFANPSFSPPPQLQAPTFSTAASPLATPPSHPLLSPFSHSSSSSYLQSLGRSFTLGSSPLSYSTTSNGQRYADIAESAVVIDDTRGTSLSPGTPLARRLSKLSLQVFYSADDDEDEEPNEEISDTARSSAVMSSKTKDQSDLLSPLDDTNIISTTAVRKKSLQLKKSATAAVICEEEHEQPDEGLDITSSPPPRRGELITWGELHSRSIVFQHQSVGSGTDSSN
ncbi:uncharacterized protein V1518DRAFT_414739 [Limtongia smithiae]|uniref:uncharacterized protein n=1 Tax=Limtongia smithiae TaxID=1125753 RepID=UPI0034CE6BE6